MGWVICFPYLAVPRFAPEASQCGSELLHRTLVPLDWAGKSRHLPKAVSWGGDDNVFLGAEQLLVYQLGWMAQEKGTDLGLQLSSRQLGLCDLCSQLLAVTASSCAWLSRDSRLVSPSSWGVGPAVWPCSLRWPPPHPLLLRALKGGSWSLGSAYPCSVCWWPWMFPGFKVMV